LEQVKGLAALTVLRVDVADVQVTDVRGYTGGVKAALVVKGDLVLSTDLSAARFESVDVEHRTAVLVLPPPRVSSPRVDHSRTRLLWVWRYGLWQAVPGDRPHAAAVNRAYEEAQAVIAAAGKDLSLDGRARAQAESVLRTFFEAVGWRLRVRWSDRPLILRGDTRSDTIGGTRTASGRAARNARPGCGVGGAVWRLSCTLARNRLATSNAA
jgi:hypothetical protein